MSEINWFRDNVFQKIDDYQWFYESFSSEADAVLKPVGLKIEVGFKALRHAHGRWTNLQYEALGKLTNFQETEQTQGYLISSFAYLFYCLNGCNFEQHLKYVDKKRIVSDADYAPLFARKEAINVSFCTRAFLSSYDTIYGKPYPNDLSHLLRKGWVSLVDRMRAKPNEAAEIFLELIKAKQQTK